MLKSVAYTVKRKDIAKLLSELENDYNVNLYTNKIETRLSQRYLSTAKTFFKIVYPLVCLNEYSFVLAPFYDFGYPPVTIGIHMKSNKLKF